MNEIASECNYERCQAERKLIEARLALGEHVEVWKNGNHIYSKEVFP